MAISSTVIRFIQNELNERGVLNGPPGDDPGVVALDIESAVVRVVATQVGVDRLGHRCDVTPAVDFPGSHDQPRHLTPYRAGEVGRAEVLCLLETGRQRVTIGPSHNFATGCGRGPRSHRPTPWLPGRDGTDGDHFRTPHALGVLCSR